MLLDDDDGDGDDDDDDDDDYDDRDRITWQAASAQYNLRTQ